MNNKFLDILLLSSLTINLYSQEIERAKNGNYFYINNENIENNLKEDKYIIEDDWNVINDKNDLLKDSQKVYTIKVNNNSVNDNEILKEDIIDYGYTNQVIENDNYGYTNQIDNNDFGYISNDNNEDILNKEQMEEKIESRMIIEDFPKTLKPEISELNLSEENKEENIYNNYENTEVDNIIAPLIEEIREEKTIFENKKNSPINSSKNIIKK